MIPLEAVLPPPATRGQKSQSHFVELKYLQEFPEVSKGMSLKQSAGSTSPPGPALPPLHCLTHPKHSDSRMHGIFYVRGNTAG